MHCVTRFAAVFMEHTQHFANSMARPQRETEKGHEIRCGLFRGPFKLNSRLLFSACLLYHLKYNALEHKIRLLSPEDKHSLQSYEIAVVIYYIFTLKYSYLLLYDILFFI